MIVPKPRKLPSGKWFIYLRLGGEKIPISAYSEKDCIRKAEVVKAQHRAGKRQDNKQKNNLNAGCDITLSEAIDHYIEKRSAILSPSTIRGYRIIQHSRFKETMGRKISDISQNEWQKICNDERKNTKCSTKTLKNAWGLISSVIAEATGASPSSVKLPQIVRAERPFLEYEQVKTFVREVKGTNVEIPALLALSSLRRSEIMGLRWENVDLKRKIIVVKGASVFNEENKIVQKEENKNFSSARTVPIMMDELYLALSERRKLRPEDEFVVTEHPDAIWRAINKVCENADLPKVGIHGLRHSFVSLAYHLEVPEKIVMEIGGWSDFQTMRKIYTHIAKSDISKYTEKIQDFFNDPSPQT